MSCPRCEGLVIEETEVDEEGIRVGVRCVNCGWRPGGVRRVARVNYPRRDDPDRHRRYREKMRRLGRCIRCGRPATDGQLCHAHRLKERLLNRVRMRVQAGHQAWRPGGLGRPPLPT